MEGLQEAQSPAEPHASAEVPAQEFGVTAVLQQPPLHDSPPAQLVPHLPVALSHAWPAAQSALLEHVA